MGAFSLTGFNGSSIHQVLFNAWNLKNRVHCTFIFSFLFCNCFFWGFFFFFLRTIPSNTNKILNISIWPLPLGQICEKWQRTVESTTQRSLEIDLHQQMSYTGQFFWEGSYPLWRGLQSVYSKPLMWGGDLPLCWGYSQHTLKPFCVCVFGGWLAPLQGIQSVYSKTLFCVCVCGGDLPLCRGYSQHILKPFCVCVRVWGVTFPSAGDTASVF